MPTDQYQEIVFVIVSAIVLFVALVGIVVFTMLYYQKKRFQHIREKQALAEAYQKQLLQSRLEMQEETFNTISREIHDNVGQLLSLAKVQLNIAGKNDTPQPQLLDEIKANIGQAMTDLRDIAKSLSSDRLQRLTLAEAVQHELNRIGRSGAMKATMQVNGAERPLPEQHAIILLRMVQEGIQNALKHADARLIHVDLEFGERNLRIAVVDDGIGFDPDSAPSSGLGLHNLMTRASLIGGTATIASAIGHGTKITLDIPYD